MLKGLKIRTIVTNRWVEFPDLELEQIDWLTQYFRYRVRNYEWMPRYRSGAWDGYKSMMWWGEVPTGLFLDRREHIEQKAKCRFVITDNRQLPAFKELTPEHIRQEGPEVLDHLRYYQREAVTAMVEASGTGGLILNATGSGKTFIAGAYFSLLDGRGCFVVDELTLLEQARSAFAKLLHEHIGVVGNMIFDPARITVATIQSLQKHSKKKEFRKWFKTLDVLIVDEIHKAINKRSVSVIRKIQPKAVFGLTATLELQKLEVRMQVVSMAGPPIYNYPYEQGVKDNVLSNGVVVRVLCAQPGKFYKNPTEDYNAVIVNSKLRNQLIEDLVRAGIAAGRTVIVLVQRLRHLAILSKRLKDIPHEVMQGKRKMKERRAAQARMNKRKLPLIIANVVFGTGIDISTLDMIIDGTASPSKNNAAQRFGRGSRKDKLKDGLIYLDISDRSTAVGLSNRFQKPAWKRALAFKKLNVPIVRIKGTTPAAEIIERAIGILKSIIARNELGALPTTQGVAKVLPSAREARGKSPEAKKRNSRS